MTPTTQLSLSGLPGSRVSEGCLDPLSATCIVFESNGYRIAIISVDLLYVSEALVQGLREFASAKYGIPATNTLVCATHTHSAPATHPQMFEEATVDSAYVKQVRRACESALTHAVEDLQPSQIEFGAGPTAIAVNRRRRVATMRRGAFPRIETLNRPNVRGPNDGRVRVLRVTRRPRSNQERTPPVYLVNCACHPSILRGNQISADYPGRIRERLVRIIGTDLNLIFLQGFAGNLRANLTINERPSDWSLRRFAKFAFDRHQFNKDTSLEEVYAIAEELARDIAAVPLRPLKNGSMSTSSESAFLALNGKRDIESLLSASGLSQTVRERVQNYLLSGDDGNPGALLHLQRLSIGNIHFIGVNAEIFTEYSAALSVISQDFVIPIGYANGMIGYVPNSKAIAEGGYEPDRSRVLFGLPAKFAPRIEGEINAAFRSLLTAENTGPERAVAV